MIQIIAQTFEPGQQMASQEMFLPAGSVTLTPDTSVPGQFTISAADLETALQSAGMGGAHALSIRVDDGDGDMMNDPSSVAWLKPVIVKYTEPVDTGGGAEPAGSFATYTASGLKIDVSDTTQFHHYRV